MGAPMNQTMNVSGSPGRWRPVVHAGRKEKSAGFLINFVSVSTGSKREKTVLLGPERN